MTTVSWMILKALAELRLEHCGRAALGGSKQFQLKPAFYCPRKF
jgi:hypothetical protein